MGDGKDSHLFAFRGRSQRAVSSLCFTVTSSREGLPMSCESTPVVKTERWNRPRSEALGGEEEGACRKPGPAE